MEINIQSMYTLSPMDVIYKMDGVETNMIVLIDFVRGHIYDPLNGCKIEGDLKNKITEIIEEKKQVVLNPVIPLDSMEFVTPTPSRKEEYGD